MATNGFSEIERLPFSIRILLENLLRSEDEWAARQDAIELLDEITKALADGEVLETGGHSLKWLDAPHLPHGWDAGYMFEENTQTLFCGDLFTQPGLGQTPVTEGDILEPSEAFRVTMDYFSHSKNAPMLLERLALLKPATLACMHGSVWQGDGATLLRALSGRLSDK